MSTQTTAVALPDISGLSQYIAKWGSRDTMRERLEERCITPFSELKAFHAAILPVLEPLVDFLDQFHPDEIPVEYVALANTVMTVCEIDKAVTHWRASMLRDALDPRRFIDKRSEVDWDLVDDISLLPTGPEVLSNEAPAVARPFADES